MNKAVDDVYLVADWFLHIKEMTHKKLQKLLYLSYGIYLIQNNTFKDKIENILFDNTFEAWVHGPVEPYIYSLYKYNGINLLYKEDIIKVSFNDKVLNALNYTMNKYGNLDADILEEITHKHICWIKAREGLDSITPSNNTMSNEDIYVSFDKMING